MKQKKADRLIKMILKEDPTEAGIFISLLSHAYINTFNMTEQEFVKHIRNSLKILDSDEE